MLAGNTSRHGQYFNAVCAIIWTRLTFGKHCRDWLGRLVETLVSSEVKLLCCTSINTATVSRSLANMSSRLVLVLGDLFIPDRAIVSIALPALAVHNRPS